MIAHIHVTNQLSPPEHTRNTLQAEYWILHARAQIRKVCKSCYACRRQLAYGIQPEMAALPYNRFPSEKPFPFQNTGPDVFGPLASQIANTYNKRYRLILTCQLHVPCTSKCVKTSPPMPPSVRFFARRGTLPTVVHEFFGNSNSLVLQPSTYASLRRRMGTPHPKPEKRNVC